MELFPAIVSRERTIEVISSGMLGSHSGSLQLVFYFTILSLLCVCVLLLQSLKHCIVADVWRATSALSISPNSKTLLPTLCSAD